MKIIVKKILSVFMPVCMIMMMISLDHTTERPDIQIAENINKSSSLKLSDYAVNVEYIPLETTSNELLTGSERVAVSPDHFIVFSKECLAFNRKGKFVQKIGSAGKGPGEYLNAYGAYFYPGNQLIYLPNTAYESILVYSPDNRLVDECQQSKQHSFGETRTVTNNMFFKYRLFLLGNSEWNIHLFNCSGDSVSTILNPYKYDGISNFGYSNECEFYYYKNELHLKEAYSNTIYRFNKVGQHLPKYVLNLDKYNVPPAIREDSNTFRDRFPSDFFAVRGIFETDSYLLFKYLHKRSENIIIFNKQTRKVENFISKENYDGIENDFDGGPYFFPVNNDNELFVQLINSYELIAHVASREFKNSSPKFPEKKKQLEELAASLDENDNPVLMLVKLKP